jgi:hypothetical protein
MLKISPEAARAVVKRHRLPRSRSNHGKTLVQIDLAEISHSPLSRGPQALAGHPVVTDLTLLALIDTSAAIAQTGAGLDSPLSCLAPISAASHGTAVGNCDEILREKPRRCRSLSSIYYRSMTSDPRPQCAVVARPARLHCKIAGRGIGIAVPKLLGYHGVAIRLCAVVFRGSSRRLRG